MSTVLVFDLDDTLYPERDFALSGFKAAERWASAELGLAPGLAREMTRLLDVLKQREQQWKKLQQQLHQARRAKVKKDW